MRVLVVDDEKAIAEMIATGLETEGIDTVCVFDGRSALLHAHEVDAIVLDWMLPDIDGMAVLQTLRDQGDATPVLMVTALGDVEEKVEALALADDYLTKPFELPELVARIQAISRRREEATNTSPAILSAGNLVVNTALREVFADNDKVSLTPTEYNLLELLIRHKGEAVSRVDVFAHVWGYDFGGNRANLDTAISSLRRKLAEHNCDVIETARGFGYLIRNT